MTNATHRAATISASSLGTSYEVELTCSLAAWMLDPPTEDTLTRNAVL